MKYTSYIIQFILKNLQLTALALVVCFVVTACGGGGSGGAGSNLAEGLVKIVLGIAPGASASEDAYRFNYPQDAIEDTDGTVYVAETQSHVIRRIKNGRVELFAGDLQPGFNGDGDRLTTRFNTPTAITKQGRKLYVADALNFLIRTIDIDSGKVETLAGIPNIRGWPAGDLNFQKSSIEYVSWLGFDSHGVLWAAMSSDSGRDGPRLYRLNTGTSNWDYFKLPDFIPKSAINSFYVEDGGSINILVAGQYFRLSTFSQSSRSMSTRYGGGLLAIDGNKILIGDHTSILNINLDGSEIGRLPINFANVVSIKKAFSDGYLVVDSDDGRILRISEKGDILWSTGSDIKALGVVVSLSFNSTKNELIALDNARPSVVGLNFNGDAQRVAGNGSQRWADINVNAKNTGYYYPSAIAIDGEGNIFIAEQNRIMRVDAKTRESSLYCGYETAGNIYDVTCAAARFTGIRGLAFDRENNLYVADTYNSQIKKISNGGALVTLIAGRGVGRESFELLPKFDVLATMSPLNRPHAVRVSDAGLIYIADSWNNAVYTLEAGKLKLLAGNPGRAAKWIDANAPYQGQGEYGGDGGLAINAKLNTPSDIAMCPNGDILIADEFNFAIRRVDKIGRITTVLGGSEGYASDGSRTSWLHSVVCDSEGFFAADVGNAVVWRVGRGYVQP
jgi:DNA-binding beta-propeller fold protein YncE